MGKNQIAVKMIVTEEEFVSFISNFIRNEDGIYVGKRKCFK